MFKYFLKVLILEKSSWKFIFAVILGLSFSISVILGTFGIMDGFEQTLKSGLRKSEGDLMFFSSKSMFQMDEDLIKTLKKLKIESYTPLFQTEAFVLFNQQNKGVLLKGISKNHFKEMFPFASELKPGSIILGKELALELGIKTGEEMVLALGQGNKSIKGLPELRRVKVDGQVTHGIYQKDLRTVYIELDYLQSLLGAVDKINLVTLKVPQIEFEKSEENESEIILNFQKRLSNKLGGFFRTKVYWSEYSSLIEAVGIEKFMIGLILQIVVVISIFNVLAFIIFISEQKSKELFLFKALGLTQSRIIKAWFVFIIILWGISCGISLLLVDIFDLFLRKASFLNLPGEVYHLGRLSISLSYSTYMNVFMLALVWLLLISGAFFLKMRKRPILDGLRKEFG